MNKYPYFSIIVQKHVWKDSVEESQNCGRSSAV